jgi:hypothetical protein
MRVHTKTLQFVASVLTMLGVAVGFVRNPASFTRRNSREADTEAEDGGGGNGQGSIGASRGAPNRTPTPPARSDVPDFEELAERFETLRNPLKLD